MSVKTKDGVKIYYMGQKVSPPSLATAGRCQPTTGTTRCWTSRRQMTTAISSPRLRPRRQGWAVLTPVSRHLEQEPGAALGLVDPVFQETGGSDIAVLIAKVVCFAHAGRELPVVVAQFGKHVVRRHVVGIIIQDAFQAPDMADRADRGATDFADPLRNIVGGGENLLAMLVQHQMVVAEMRARDVPVEVLGFDIQREHIGEFIDPGLIVAGTALGTAELYNRVPELPARFLPTSYTHSPQVLSQLHSLVSVNFAVEVDLSGQVGAEVSRGVYIGAVGGQVDFTRAAALTGKRSIIALRATSGGQSTIKAALDGGVVTTTRSDVDNVVTEYGVAHLRGCSLRERARRMAAIAAPEFRDQLDRERNTL